MPICDLVNTPLKANTALKANTPLKANAALKANPPLKANVTLKANPLHAHTTGRAFGELFR